MSSPANYPRPESAPTILDLSLLLATARPLMPGRHSQWSRRPSESVTRFRKSQQWRHVTSHFGLAARRLIGPPHLLRIIQVALPRGLLGAQKMPRRKLLGDHLPCLRRGEEASVISQPYHPRIQARNWPERCPQQGHMVHHLTLRANLTPQAAPRQLLGELGCLLQNVARAG